MEGAAQLDWQVCMCHLYGAVSYENILLIGHYFQERDVFKCNLLLCNTCMA